MEGGILASLSIRRHSRPTQNIGKNLLVATFALFFAIWPITSVYSFNANKANEAVSIPEYQVSVEKLLVDPPAPTVAIVVVESEYQKQQKIALEAQKKAQTSKVSSVTQKSQIAAVKSHPVVYPQSTDYYKNFIYQKESGNNPASVNRNSGACGLGQALPCSKMPCSLSDYSCQDSFFTAYMQNRYGSWQNAYAHWQQHHWW